MQPVVDKPVPAGWLPGPSNRWRVSGNTGDAEFDKDALGLSAEPACMTWLADNPTVEPIAQGA